MNRIILNTRIGLLIFIFVITSAGCSVKLIKRHPQDIEKIEELSMLAQMSQEELQRLRQAYDILQNKLQKEIGEKQVRLGLDERGLTITFLAEVLFDSGKSKIRQEAYEVLNKVTDVIKEKLAEQTIGIEGHTDNEPIKYSGWKSNWELSTARAISVLHYLVDEKGLPPKLVSAIGYGEYRPIVTNDTPEGRQENRRVEIVVLPKYVSKAKVTQHEPRIEGQEERYYK